MNSVLVFGARSLAAEVEEIMQKLMESAVRKHVAKCVEDEEDSILIFLCL